MRFLLLILLCALTSSTQCYAQSEFASLLARGRVMLDNDDARALQTLQKAAEISQNATAIEQTRAFLAWSRAAQKWRSRDDAVEILARGVSQLMLKDATKDATELRNALAPLLIDGLPLSASQKTLQTLSQIVARDNWKLQPLSLALPQNFAHIEYSKSRARDFLITNGALFVNGKNADGAPQLWRTPPLYAAYSDLPPTLKMNRVVYGFASDKTQFVQVVRVLYADVDAAEKLRAERVCRDFLRVWNSFDGALSRRNLYSPVTTIWLSRESALWPQPENATAWNAGAQLDSAPSEMILFRTSEARPPAEWLREIAHEYSHIALPPFAGYAPPLEPFGNGVLGETLLMLWALGSPQSYFAPEETEEARRNLRVHVARYAIPAWKTAMSRDPRTPIRGDDEAARRALVGLTLHIERVYGARVLRNALSQLDGDDLEKQRQAALALAQRRAASVSSSEILRAEALRLSLARVLDKPFAASEKASLWIGGALSQTRLSPDELASRAPLILKANQRSNGWIYVPRGAKQLRIENNTSSTRRLVANGWKITPSKNATILSCESKSGWQRLEEIGKAHV